MHADLNAQAYGQNPYNSWYPNMQQHMLPGFGANAFPGQFPGQGSPSPAASNQGQPPQMQDMLKTLMDKNIKEIMEGVNNEDQSGSSSENQPMDWGRVREVRTFSHLLLVVLFFHSSVRSYV